MNRNGSKRALGSVKSMVNENASIKPIVAGDGRLPHATLGVQLNAEARIAVVAQLAIQGLTQVEIGERLGVLQDTVSSDLQEARRRWLDASIIAYDTMKAGELARVNEIERQQWTELDALSQEEDDERRKSWWTTRQKNAYNRIMWCVEQRCKLFGLYAPQEIVNWKAEAAQHGYDPDTIYHILVHEMSNIINGQARPVLLEQVAGQVIDDDASDTAL